MEAYREAALTSSVGAAALSHAYQELFLVSGEGPRSVFFDERLIEALRSYIPQMSETDRVNVRWVLKSINAISATDRNE